MEYKTNEVVYLPTDILREDPEAIRPEIGSVADIEPSIQRSGIIYPIEVRAADEAGCYYICEGNRRVFVARKIGLEIVPAHIRDVDASGARQLMLLSDLRRSQPHVVVRHDEIVGGLALAVRNEKEQYGASNQELAEMLGDQITADTVGAYLALFDEDIEIVKAVASGKLAITAYSRMKSQPDEIKKRIIAKNNKSISANDVREEIKRHRRDTGDADHDLPFLGEIEESTVELNRILANLRRFQGASLKQGEPAILEMIITTAEDIILEG